MDKCIKTDCVYQPISVNCISCGDKFRNYQPVQQPETFNINACCTANGGCYIGHEYDSEKCDCIFNTKAKRYNNTHYDVQIALDYIASNKHHPLNEGCSCKICKSYRVILSFAQAALVSKVEPCNRCAGWETRNIKIKEILDLYENTEGLEVFQHCPTCGRALRRQ